MILFRFAYYCILLTSAVAALPTLIVNKSRDVSQALFDSLEELARIVDISYCVGSTGVHKPFECLSRCHDFVGFELVESWNTGPLLSDSCGYIAVSHPPHPKRVIVAFRGTYSIASTIADLSTVPAEYAPYPGTDDDSICTSALDGDHPSPILPQLFTQHTKRSTETTRCDNCTVHHGFMRSWRNTRCIVVQQVESALAENPGYELTLVGHSLGGAVAALAALEFQARGWDPHVTTFGEPRLGNRGLNEFIDRQFNLSSVDAEESKYRRVTHVDDPVPLLPLEEWGYHMHAGEIFISKSGLPPIRDDLQHCEGDEDPLCISDSASEAITPEELQVMQQVEGNISTQGWWSIRPRYKLWQLFFAHRDYFWRLGLCIPGGDPWDWSREKYPTMEMSDEL